MKVLLAIDDDPSSEAAVAEVAGRSWPSETTVRVLHTLGQFVPPAQGLWYDAGGDLERARREIRDHSQQLAESVAERLGGRGLSVEPSVRDGEPGPAIVEEAKEWGADLIVVGSRGHTGVKRLLAGSVSQYVVDHAHCPVEVVNAKRSGEREDV